MRSFTLAFKADVAATAPRAAEQLHALYDKKEGLHQELLRLGDLQQEHRQEVAYGRTRIASLDPRRAGRAIELEKARIAPHEAEIERRQPGIDKAREAYHAVGGVFTACMELLERNAGRFVDAPLPVVETSSAGLPQAVEEQRGRLGELRERRGAVEKAPRSVTEAVEQVKTHFARLRETGAPDVRYLLHPGGSVNDVRWPETRRDFRQHSNESAYAIVPDVPALLAWLYGDDLEAALVAEIEAAAGSQATETLTDAERARLLSELEEEILQAERVEEAMIRAAAAEGLEILRRPAADPRAVLSVEAC